MSAQPKPLPVSEPTYGQLRAQLDVYRAELEVVRKSQPGVMLAAMRLILREADPACAHGADHLRLGALYAVRKLALDAIADTKERTCG